MLYPENKERYGIALTYSAIGVGIALEPLRPRPFFTMSWVWWTSIFQSFFPYFGPNASVPGQRDHKTNRSCVCVCVIQRLHCWCTSYQSALHASFPTDLNHKVCIFLCVCSMPSLKFIKEFLRFSVSGPGHWGDNNTKNQEEWPQKSPRVIDSD